MLPAATAIRGAVRPRGFGWLTWSVWTVSLGVLAALGVLAFVLHRGDAEGSERLANAQIEASLDAGERVVARVPVYQRQWWDYYRHTFGVLAATERRLIFVGVPPEPLLHQDRGPRPMVESNLPYARGVTVVRRALFLRRDPGVALTGPGVHVRLAITPRATPQLDAVLAELSRADSALRAAQEAERRAAEATVAASRRAIHHLVQPGEALEYIARRYGVPMDSVVTWNRLTSTKIRAGMRLLVRPERE